ncbi:hypothetical protein YTPLAS18_16990 [Nitrospira sp.]|nr:hypothetical protein YTPLAS18_16990 [Nitrospira sp.]
MDYTSTEVRAVAKPRRKRTKKYAYTGSKSGVRGIVAAALLRQGMSVSEVATRTELCRDTVAAIRQRWAEGLKHMEPIRETIRDLGLLTAAELLFGVSEKDIPAMPTEKRLTTAAKLLEQYAPPERAEGNPVFQILNQYNLTPSHSTSERTIATTAKLDPPESPSASNI